MIQLNDLSADIKHEASKKYISFKELKSIDKTKLSKSELQSLIYKINDLLSFYNRIIKSLKMTISKIEKTFIPKLDEKRKSLKQQYKDLAQAEREKRILVRYIKEFKEQINNLN